VFEVVNKLQSINFHERKSAL